MDHYDTKIVQNFKEMCKNLPFLNLSNEGDDLVLETDASNEHWGAVVKTKKAKNSVNIVMKVLIRQNAIIPR